VTLRSRRSGRSRGGRRIPKESPRPRTLMCALGTAVFYMLGQWSKLLRECNPTGLHRPRKPALQSDDRPRCRECSPVPAARKIIRSVMGRTDLGRRRHHLPRQQIQNSRRSAHRRRNFRRQGKSYTRRVYLHPSSPPTTFYSAKDRSRSRPGKRKSQFLNLARHGSSRTVIAAPVPSSGHRQLNRSRHSSCLSRLQELTRRRQTNCQLLRCDRAERSPAALAMQAPPAGRLDDPFVTAGPFPWQRPSGRAFQRPQFDRRCMDRRRHLDLGRGGKAQRTPSHGVRIPAREHRMRPYSAFRVRYRGYKPQPGKGPIRSAYTAAPAGLCRPNGMRPSQPRGSETFLTELLIS
jgi:hypothetical protein